MGPNQTKVRQLESIQGEVIQPQEVNSNPTQTIQNSRRMAPRHSTQLKFLCGHIIHKEESKLVRWGITQAKETSQNRKWGLHKDLHKSYTSIYTIIYTRSYINIYTMFEVLRLKIDSDGTLVQMGVTKPSVTYTKELKNHQKGSIKKWNLAKHQVGPLNHDLGSIIPT